MDFFKILKGGVGVGMSNFDRLFAERYGGGAWQLTALTGALPLSFKSKGAPLTDYKLYGTAEGAGVETESGEPTGYKLPMTVESGETENLFDKDEYLNAYKSNTILNEYGSEISSTVNGYSTYKINVIPEQTYTLKGQTSAAYTYYSRMYWLGSNDEFLGRSDSFENVFSNSIFTFTTPQNCYKIEMQFSVGLDFSDVMLVKGSTAPDHYIPHRYTTDTPIYIGDSKLMAEEYVDYESGKVYKRTENLFNWGKAKLNTGVTWATGEEIQINGRNLSDYMPVEVAEYTTSDDVFFLFYNEQKEYVGYYDGSNFVKTGANVATSKVSVPYTGYIRIIIFGTIDVLKSFMLAKGSTPPETYIPYLLPTDPPIALPELSTYQGENTLSCSEALGESSITGYIKGV